MTIHCPHKAFLMAARVVGRMLLTCGIVAPLACGAAAQTEKTEKTFSQDEIRQWVTDLGDDQFSKRQNATLKLVVSGLRSVGEIERAISRGDADVRIRGIGVLKILAIDPRSELHLGARNALRRLAQSELPAVARDATATLHLVGLMDQAVLAVRFKQLGAEISVKQYRDEGRDFSVPDSISVPADWNGKPADLLLIGKLNSVTQLSFNTFAVNDDLIEQISHLPNLRSLSIKRASISNRSIGFLEKLKTLQSLEILYCSIDENCIENILKCQMLSSLKLIGTGISTQHMAILRERLSADVDIRRGAFMGIYYNRGSNQCRLTNVAADSGAEKAGLQTGDLIVGIDGFEIAEPTDLTKHLRSKGVGDRAIVKFLRREKPYEVEIVFGEWE